MCCRGVDFWNRIKVHEVPGIPMGSRVLDNSLFFLSPGEDFKAMQ